MSFVRALCAVSLEELESRSPRVYSLAKIVECAHFNMDRIRLVWSRIWSVLSDFFVTVGLLKNLPVAMYVVDSLRQLSMKFLARDELANYSFQNDFFRPYVVIMRNSVEVPIRELIIRCMAQMVAARVGNVKSGWKSLFMVFTTAANDSQRSIVVLAFETIERIMRQHFNHIVETDSSAFTDCVNWCVSLSEPAARRVLTSRPALAQPGCLHQQPLLLRGLPQLHRVSPFLRPQAGRGGAAGGGGGGGGCCGGGGGRAPPLPRPLPSGQPRPRRLRGRGRAPPLLVPPAGRPVGAHL